MDTFFFFFTFVIRHIHTLSSRFHDPLPPLFFSRFTRHSIKSNTIGNLIGQWKAIACKCARAPRCWKQNVGIYNRFVQRLILTIPESDRECITIRFAAASSRNTFKPWPNFIDPKFRPTNETKLNNTEPYLSRFVGRKKTDSFEIKSKFLNGMKLN